MQARSDRDSGQPIRVSHASTVDLACCEFVLRPGLIVPAIDGAALSVVMGRTHSCVLMVSKEVRC